MEKFKQCEKDSKTKLFSKEGLGRAAALDPREKAKNDMRDWLNSTTETLNTEIESFEAELEDMGTAKAKKNAKPNPRVTHLDESISRHKQHVLRLEQLLRLMENDELSPEDVDGVKDLVDDYLDRNQEDFDEFSAPDDMYEEFLSQLDSMTDAVAAAPPSHTKTKENKDAKLEKEREERERERQKAAAAAVKAQLAAQGNTRLASETSLEDDRRLGGGVPGGVAPASAIVPPPPPTTAGAATAAAVAAATGITPIRGPPGMPGGATAASIVAGGAPPPPTVTAAAPPPPPPPPPPSQPPPPPPPPARPLQPTSPMTTVARPVTALPQGSPLPGQTDSSALGGQVLAQGDGANRPATAAAALLAGMQKQQQQQPAVGNTATTPPGPPQPAAAASTISATAAAQQPVIGGRQQPPPPPVSIEQQTQEKRAFADGGMEQLQSQLASMALTDVGPTSLTPAQSSQLLQACAARSIPQTNDMYWQQMPTRPRPPGIPMPASYPTVPLTVFQNPALFEKLDVETLFYSFYFQPGSRQQLMAARELKRQAWRYHKGHSTWFQRHEEPKAGGQPGDDWEQGTYVYFDSQLQRADGAGWCYRLKQDFMFDYTALEDELV
jgi:CCR4-NOT transcription complex subunit 3